MLPLHPLPLQRHAVPHTACPGAMRQTRALSLLSPAPSSAAVRRSLRSAAFVRTCRCQAGGNKPFLQQLGEWGARLSASFTAWQKNLLRRAQGHHQSLPEKQRQHKQHAQTEPNTAPAASLRSGVQEETVWFSPRLPAQLSREPQLSEEELAESIHQRMREAVQDFSVEQGDPFELEEWMLPSETPVVPSPPEAGDAAPWQEWQEFFEAMDKNALWCRGTLQYIQAISSHNSERFDLAAKWQQALDDNNQQNLVYSVLEELDTALESQDYQRAAYLRDAGCTGLLGWWYAVGDDDRPGGHLLQVVAEPFHGSFSGYMITANDLCTIEAQHPRSMINGDLGRMHNQDIQQMGHIVIQAQEVKPEGQQDEPPTIDDLGHPVMEVYLSNAPDGQLRHHASALRAKPEVPEADGMVTVVGEDGVELSNVDVDVVSEEDMQGVQLDVQETENGALLSFSITGSMSVPEAASAPQEDTPSTSEPQDAAADARRGLLALLQALPGISTEDRVRLQEMQAKLDPAQAAQEVPGSSGAPGEDAGTLDAAREAGSSAELGDGAHEDAEVGTYHVEWPWLGRDETTLDNMERVKADILMLDRNRFSITVHDDSPAESSGEEPAQPDSGLNHRSARLRERIKELTERVGESSGLKDLAKKIGIQMSDSRSISPNALSQILQGVFMHMVVKAVGQNSSPEKESGLRGTTQYARIPVDFVPTDPFAGVFLDPFNQKGPELFLLERAKAEDGEDSVTAVKLTSTENVAAGTVAFRAGLGAGRGMPTVGVYVEELAVTSRYKAQCRLASVDHLNARWNDAELLQFSSAAPHGANLGLVTGGRGSGFQVTFLKRMDLPDPMADELE